MTTYLPDDTAPIDAVVYDPDPGDTVTFVKINGSTINWAINNPLVVALNVGSLKIWQNPKTNPPQFDDGGSTAGLPADGQSIIAGSVTYTLTDGTTEVGPWTMTAHLDGQVPVPVPDPISNGTPPSISGLTTVGSTLTVNVGSWIGNGGITYGYQWKRDGVDIGGATASTYVTVSGDIGKVITCAVTGTDTTPTTLTVSSNGIGITPVPLANTVATSISGTPVENRTLTRIAGSWVGTGPIVLTYQWYRGASPISGATSPSYTLVTADVGNTIKVRETATDSLTSDHVDSAGVTVTAAGSGPDLAYFLPYSSARTKRAASVAAHFPGTNAEQEFTGFTDLDLLTFTTQTAVSYTDLISKINSAGVSGKVIIECAWNGISQSASAINGTNKNALSANGAVDYGYTRHGQKILVRPASGYSPIIQGIASGTGGSKYTFATGLNYIEWRGMTFDGMCMKIQTSATYPTPAIMAVKSCILQNGTIDSGIFWCVSSGLGSCRVLHIENTIEDNNRCGMLGAPNYFRRWNCVNTGHCDNDWNGIRGYAGYALNWRAYIWMAGNLLYSPSQTGYLTSGNHLDYMQCSTTAAAGNIKDHDFLIEFNVIYMNRPGNAGGPQGLFGDDGTATGTWDWLVHNNIIAIGAYWAMKPFDPNDNGEKWVVRNIFARKGHGPGYNSQNPSVRNDTAPALQGKKARTGFGTGFLKVYDNIYATTYAPTGVVNGEDFQNNWNCDPRKSAASGVKMQDVFTGNGTWNQSAGDSMWEYDIGDQGQPSGTARSLIRDFFAPIKNSQGYASALGHVGCTDPDMWPTDFRNLS